MSHDPLECNWCKSTSQVFYCSDCTTLQCKSCAGTRTIAIWHCTTCDQVSNSSICAACGETCVAVEEVEKDSCANCLGVELHDPDEVLRSLPSNYFATVTKVKDILPQITEINNNFDFFISLVRQCRIAGLLAFPQIEDRLTRCAKGMEQINKRTITHLNKVRRRHYSKYSICLTSKMLISIDIEVVRG